MEIVRKAAFKVVGLPVRVADDQRWIEMPKAWKALFARAEEIPHCAAPAFVEVTVAKGEGASDEIVGCEVSEIDRVPEGMTALEIPAQTYLHHRHAGPPHAIATAYGEMLTWARRNHCALGGFKLDFGYTRDGAGSAHDLYVKVV